MGTGKVTFGRGMSMAGVFGGVAIALGLPAIMVTWGAHLPVQLVGAVIVMALLMGGVCVLVSAFFSSVMPEQVESAEVMWTKPSHARPADTPQPPAGEPPAKP